MQEQKNMEYVFRNFFTHKDNLVDAKYIPGTVFTPLSWAFIASLTVLIVAGAWWCSNHRARIRKVFFYNWVFYAVWEVVVIVYDTLGGNTTAFDYAVNLSLYPCSLYLYMMPIILFSRPDGPWHWMGCAYICTLGLVGGTINFVYPIGQLTEYSCISFVGFHSLFYHGNLLFTFLTLIWSGEWRYTGITKARYLFMASIPTILMSIPANIVNYTVGADYMYFTGRFPLLMIMFPDAPKEMITLFMYGLYIFLPPFFFLPSYISNRLRKRKMMAAITESGLWSC